MPQKFVFCRLPTSGSHSNRPNMSVCLKREEREDSQEDDDSSNNCRINELSLPLPELNANKNANNVMIPYTLKRSVRSIMLCTWDLLHTQLTIKQTNLNNRHHTLTKWSQHQEEKTLKSWKKTTPTTISSNPTLLRMSHTYCIEFDLVTTNNNRKENQTVYGEE